MSEFTEDHITRINFGFDYAKYTRDQHLLSEKLLDLGERQFNASCNNRIARIRGLERKLAPHSLNSLEHRLEIEEEIRKIRNDIEAAKRDSVHEDYGLLKRRVSEGASTHDLYPMLPFFYAEAYELDQQIISTRKKHNVQTSLIHQIFNLLSYIVVLANAVKLVNDIITKFFDWLPR